MNKYQPKLYPKRDVAIFKERILKGTTFKVLGIKHNISLERASQIFWHMFGNGDPEIQFSKCPGFRKEWKKMLNRKD